MNKPLSPWEILKSQMELIDDSMRKHFERKKEEKEQEELSEKDELRNRYGI